MYLHKANYVQRFKTTGVCLVKAGAQTAPVQGRGHLDEHNIFCKQTDRPRGLHSPRVSTPYNPLLHIRPFP